MNYLKEMCTN